MQYLEYRGPKFRARLIGTYTAAKDRLSDSSLIGTESHYVVNLRTSMQVTDRVTVGIGINNLTDQRHVRWQSVQNNIHGSRQDQLELFQRASEPGINGFISVTVEF